MKYLKLYLALFIYCLTNDLLTQEKTNELFDRMLINYKSDCLYHGIRNRIEFYSMTERKDGIHLFSNEAIVETDSLGFIVIPLKLDSIKIGVTSISHLGETSDTLYVDFPLKIPWSSSAYLHSNNIDGYEQDEAVTYKMSVAQLSQLKGIMPILDPKFQMKSPGNILSFNIRFVKNDTSIMNKNSHFTDTVRRHFATAEIDEVFIISEILAKSNYLTYINEESKIFNTNTCFCQ